MATLHPIHSCFLTSYFNFCLYSTTPHQTNGKIYVTACPRCHSSVTKDKSLIEDDVDAESCDTLTQIRVADMKRYSGRVSFFHPFDGSIVTFGGFAITTNDKVRW